LEFCAFAAKTAAAILLCKTAQNSRKGIMINMKAMTTLQKIGRGFREIHRLEPQLIPLTLTSGVTKAALPFVNLYFSSRIIDILSTTREMKTLILFVALALAINLFLFITSRTLENRYYMSRGLLYNKERGEVIRKLYTLDYEKLESPAFQTLLHKHQEAMDKAGSSLYRLSWMLSHWVSGATTLAFALVLLFPLLKISFKGGETFVESPWFAVALFAAIGVAVGIILIISRKISKEWFRLSEQYMGLDRLYDYYTEMIADYKTGKEIRTYQEQLIIEKDATQQLLNEGIAIQKKIAANSAKSSSLIAIIGAVIGFGIYLFIGLKGLIGLFSIGSLVCYTGSFMQVVQGVTAIANTTGQIPQIIPTLDYYFDILHTESGKQAGTLLPQMDTPVSIEFRNVSFKYPESETYALKNFSIKLENGEKLAVVGRNGSGKTTFIKLLCRLYDPQEGEILLNGVNIREYDDAAYRQLFSVVFQDFSMFSFPLAQNVSVADTYEEARVWACLEEAGIADDVRGMEQQLDTYLYKDVEETGVEISGGEAQKLALARALYKNAPFIVLDEPTAALDPIAEYEIYSKFNRLVGDKTAIYISHRLSSCRFCKHIAVFQQGELVQLGTHEELIRDPSSAYYELWNAQAQYYC
jgi:ATP-binding cassette subfamily B protein